MSFTSKSLSVVLFASCALGLEGASAQGQSPKATVRDQIKVAAVQVSGYDKGDLPREGFDPTAKLLPYINRAGKEKTDLVVFPEYVLGHIAIPGDETRIIAAAAKRYSLYVVVGCWEKLSGDKYANAILVFGRDGAIVGKYYKTHPAIDHFDGQPAWLNPPTGKTREWFLQNDPEWTMEPGKSLPVLDLDFGKVGILTCYDGWFPEPARVLSLKGAELLLWINGRGGAVEEFIVKTTMFQSHVAMIATNQAYGAGTMIGQWPTRIVAKCPDREESYIAATIDLKRVRRARANSRNFRQRRPDLYGELVKPLDQNRQPPKPEK